MCFSFFSITLFNSAGKLETLKESVFLKMYFLIGNTSSPNNALFIFIFNFFFHSLLTERLFEIFVLISNSSASFNCMAALRIDFELIDENLWAALIASPSVSKFCVSKYSDFFLAHTFQIDINWMKWGAKNWGRNIFFLLPEQKTIKVHFSSFVLHI